MTTNEIANRLVELCRQGDFEKVQTDLFAQDAVSIEQHDSPAFAKETKGLQAIKEKGEKWNAMVQDVHSMEMSDAIVAGNSFACIMHMNVTMKDGKPMDMKELCVYTIKDDKIASEEFFM